MSYSDQFFNTLDFSPDKRWKLPFSLAIAVHLLTLLLLVAPPTFLLPDREIQEIQTISLFTAEELQQAQKPPPAKPAAAKPAPAKEPAPPPPSQELLSTAVEPPASTALPGEMVSLHPRKIKKKIVPEPPAPDLRLKALERIQARVNQQREEEQIKHELSRLRDSLHTQPQPAKPAEAAAAASPSPAAPAVSSLAPAAGGPAAGGTVALFDLAMKKYLIAINRRISDNWALPDTQTWDKDLEAIMVIVVRTDGTVSKTYFEKKSKNIYFDQYVEKTIQASLPMPPFPSDLKKNTLEIGLRFRPSGLF